MKKYVLFVILLFSINLVIASDDEITDSSFGDSELQAGSGPGDNEFGPGLILQSEEITAPTPSGGGGGTGAVTKESVNFRLNPSDVRILFNKGQRLTNMTLENPTNKELEIKLTLLGLNNIIELRYSSIILKPGEIIPLDLRFSSIKPKPGIYTGTLIAESFGITKQIPIVIEVESDITLFDVLLSIPEGYIEIEKGNDLFVEIKLDNKLNKDKKIELDVNYYIKDLSNNILYEENENLTIADLLNYNKIFKKLNLGKGDYIVGVLINHENTTSVSSASFKVKDTIQGMKKTDLTKYLILLILIFIIIIIIFLNLIILKKIKYKVPKEEKKDKNINKKIKIIKKAYKQDLIKKH